MEIPEKSPPLPFMVLRPGLRPGPSWSGEVARVGLEEQGVGGKGKRKKGKEKEEGAVRAPVYTPYIRDAVYTPYIYAVYGIRGSGRLPQDEKFS